MQYFLHNSQNGYAPFIVLFAYNLITAIIAFKLEYKP